jgi:hypothetical protein
MPWSWLRKPEPFKTGGKGEKAKRRKGFKMESFTKLFCHPERSEGSQSVGNTRFFTSLRITAVVDLEFFKSLNGFFAFPFSPFTLFPFSP